MISNGGKVHICYQFVKCLIVIEIKMVDFRKKDGLVAGGNMADPHIINTTVVSRESVCTASPITVLNDLEMKEAVISNEHVKAPAKEKAWTTLKTEFSKDVRKTAIIVGLSLGFRQKVLP